MTGMERHPGIYMEFAGAVSYTVTNKREERETAKII